MELFCSCSIFIIHAIESRTVVITQIRSGEVRTKWDKQIEKINGMIERYNEEPNILLLQQIDGLAQQIYNVYRVEPNQVSSSFMKWYFRGEIHHELRQLANESELNFNNKRMFLHLTPVTADTVPTFEKWQKGTTQIVARGLGLRGSRSEIYTKVDPYLMNISAPTSDGKHDWQFVLANLEVLQSKIIHILNNDLYEGNPKKIARFTQLLSATNQMMRNVINMSSEYTDRYKQAPDLGIIDPNTEEPGHTIPELVTHLTMTQERLQLDDYTLEYLGGNNNKNWKIINRETGDIHILRVEKAESYTDYLLLNELKTNPTINRFIAVDSLFYPTEEIETVPGSGAERPYNLAISEYCPNGDLLSNRRKMNDVSPEDIASEVLGQVEQVATFMSELHRNRVAYMDLKAENFILRPNGEVITADLKSVISCPDGRVKINDISTTEEAAPPEYPESRTYDTDKFMSYQAGLMLYILMVGPSAEEKSELITQFQERGEWDFSHPVFASEGGAQIRTLINAATQQNPENRPSVGVIAQQCRAIHHDLQHDAEQMNRVDLNEEMPTSSSLRT
jgi:serine/threonine protein kinase